MRIKRAKLPSLRVPQRNPVPSGVGARGDPAGSQPARSGASAYRLSRVAILEGARARHSILDRPRSGSFCARGSSSARSEAACSPRASGPRASVCRAAVGPRFAAGSRNRVSTRPRGAHPWSFATTTRSIPPRTPETLSALHRGEVDGSGRTGVTRFAQRRRSSIQQVAKSTSSIGPLELRCRSSSRVFTGLPSF